MNKNAGIIRVMLVEDHEEIRKGIDFIINNNRNFVCEAFKNVESALDEIEKVAPDVVLMDISLPGINGIEATRIIRKKYPHILVMMCTVFEDSDKIFGALKAGAHGYILKRNAGEDLLEAITDLVNGGAPMSSEIARKVVGSFNEQLSASRSDDSMGLTKRENEILDLLAKGCRNKEIAEQLHVSSNTIRTHIYNIYEKLHVQSRIEALNKTGRSSFH